MTSALRRDACCRAKMVLPCLRPRSTIACLRPRFVAAGAMTKRHFVLPFSFLSGESARPPIEHAGTARQRDWRARKYGSNQRSHEPVQPLKSVVHRSRRGVLDEFSNWRHRDVERGIKSRGSGPVDLFRRPQAQLCPPAARLSLPGDHTQVQKPREIRVPVSPAAVSCGTTTSAIGSKTDSA